MPNLRETYSSTLQGISSIRKRVNPEGLAFGGVASAGSMIMYFPQLGLIRAMHENPYLLDPELAKFLVIAGLGIINGLSVATETIALRSHGYSASYVASGVNTLIKLPLLSSIGSHLWSYSRMPVTNLVNAVTLANTIVTGNSQLLQESIIASAFVFSGWSVGMNSLVFTGRAQPLVERLKKVRVEVGGKIKQNPKVHEVFRRLGPKR